MVEVSASILNMKENEEARNNFIIRSRKSRLYSYRCNGWQVC